MSEQPPAVPLNQIQCESMGGTWNAESNTCKMPESMAPTNSDSDQLSLMREIEMLKARVEMRENQLKQAIDIANRANNERRARDEAEKQKLVRSIQMDGKFQTDELENKSLDELHTIRLTLDRTMEQTFANIAADVEEQNRRKQPLLTAGAWDSAKKQWVGGA